MHAAILKHYDFYDPLAASMRLRFAFNRLLGPWLLAQKAWIISSG